MCNNTPSILLIWKNHWLQYDELEQFIKKLKKCNIVFDDFNKAKKFINSRWDKIDDWWMSNEVQNTRKYFNENIFKFSKNWSKSYSNFFCDSL